MTSPGDPPFDPARNARVVSTSEDGAPTREGKRYIAAIGIDRYHHWNRLHNAVTDARGAFAAFRGLGFEPACEPLIDEAATRESLNALVKTELMTLNSNDSLVLFFAGHGYTAARNDPARKAGFIIPVDADPVEAQRRHNWINLKHWLGDIAILPVKHVLVIIDACHSGVALDSILRSRGVPWLQHDPLEDLRTRTSRRVITSALEDQVALDSGPLPGHSLFTGCLIEALRGDLVPQFGHTSVTGTELGLYVQRRVTTYPSYTRRQTPDFGPLESDDRGELTFELPRRTYEPGKPGLHNVAPKGHSHHVHDDATPESPQQRGLNSVRSKRALAEEQSTERTKRSIEPVATQSKPQDRATAPSQKGAASTADSIKRPTAPPDSATESTKPDTDSKVDALDAAITSKPDGGKSPAQKSEPHAYFDLPLRANAAADPPALAPPFLAAMRRHEQARRNTTVTSVVVAEPTTALTGWATWAASRGWITLVLAASDLDSAITELLLQMPWFRIAPYARTLLAQVAGTDVASVDAVFQLPAPQRDAWLREHSGHDAATRVSAWILTLLRKPWATARAHDTAPVHGLELLAALAVLAAPISILFHNAKPTASWADGALDTASQLIEYLPRHATAVAMPREVLTQVLTETRLQATLTAGRDYSVELGIVKPRPLGARQRAAEALLRALDDDPRTASLFVRNAQIATTGFTNSVYPDLASERALLAIELDDWHYVRDPLRYRANRDDDEQLQRANYFVLRFLAEDIEQRLDRVVEEIALSVAARRASDLPMENHR